MRTPRLPRFLPGGYGRCSSGPLDICAMMAGSFLGAVLVWIQSNPAFHAHPVTPQIPVKSVSAWRVRMV